MDFIIAPFPKIDSKRKIRTHEKQKPFVANYYDMISNIEEKDDDEWVEDEEDASMEIFSQPPL